MREAEPGVAARRQLGLPDEQHRGGWLARFTPGGVAVFAVLGKRFFIVNHPRQGGL